MMRHCFFAIFLSVSSVTADDGIFADFTTSLGSFTVELNAEQAPRTVANFVSLAEGSRPWMDPSTGAVRVNQPYYDGLLFHRVIADFMSQSGSRNGLGTDGPGYRLRDEFSPSLTHQRHVISMANSGVNTNGAQFFITDATAFHLDGKHSVFGHVVAGGNVVDAINAVPTGANDRPLTPVVIQTVNIRRVGVTAETFDVTAWSLPLLSTLPGNLAVTPGGPILYRIQPAASRTVTQAHKSLDLTSWSPSFSRNEYQNNIDLSTLQLGTANTDRAFFNISQAHYPDALPSSLASRVFDVEITGNLQFKFIINSNGETGTCEFTDHSGTTLYPIQEVHAIPDLWNAEYLFNVNTFGILGVIVTVKQDTTTLLSGSSTLFQYNGSSWTSINSGTFTLTK